MTEEIQDVDKFLNSLITRVITWDRNIVEQAVYAFGWCNQTVSANDFRRLLPDLAHGHVGIVIRSMAARRMLRPALDQHGYPMTVRSTAESTHGKPIQCWTLTPAGRDAAERMLRKREAAA